MLYGYIFLFNFHVFAPIEFLGSWECEWEHCIGSIFQTYNSEALYLSLETNNNFDVLKA